MSNRLKIRKLLLIILLGIVLLEIGSWLIRRSRLPHDIFVDVITRFDNYVYDKQWAEAESLFISKPVLAKSPEQQPDFVRYCNYMSQFIPEFKDVYAYFSRNKETIVGSFRRKNMNDLKYYYFLDVIIVKRNNGWAISQMRIPEGFVPPEDLL